MVTDGDLPVDISLDIDEVYMSVIMLLCVIFKGILDIEETPVLISEVSFSVSVSYLL